MKKDKTKNGNKNNNKNAKNAKDAKTTILRDHSLAGIFISSIRYSLCIKNVRFNS